MALTEDERVSIRYHLGYLNTATGASLGLGLPAASQVAFLLESTMNTLLPAAEGRVRRCITELDCIEDQLSAARENFATKRVDEVEFDTYQEGRLHGEYIQWADTLADIFGVPINPFSKRHQMMRGEIHVIEPI